ncbi:hypothetical protein C2G38_2111775, partial [Gigaspora rosea]
STADNWTIKLFHAFNQIIKNISLIQFIICNVNFLSIIIKASLFNGAKWKGMILKIQDAKPDYKHF